MQTQPMQALSPRHVKTEEALRLGVESGWYAIKVSGTRTVTLHAIAPIHVAVLVVGGGLHDSEADCSRKIDEINPPVKKKR